MIDSQFDVVLFIPFSLTGLVVNNCCRLSTHNVQMAKDHVGYFLEVTNEEVRVRTGQHSMDDIHSERRLCWIGHVIRMDHQRIPQLALHWEVPGFKRGPGRPHTNWRSTVNKNLLN